MKKPEFDWIKRPDGSSEFEDFLESLPAKDRQKLILTVAKVEEKGLLIAAQKEWIKKLEDNLYEVRSKFGSNIQRALYFQVIDNKYMITHGFSKKQDKTPEREKQHARELRKKFERGELQ